MTTITDLVPLKPGKSSKEFLAVLLLHVGALIAAIAGGVDGALASILTTVSGSLYAIGRAWVKGPYPVLVSSKSSWKTTEFWVLILSVLANGTLAITGDISAEWAVTAGSIATMVLTITRSMVKRPAVVDTIGLSDSEVDRFMTDTFDS